jgi:amidohydrolase
VNFSMHLLEPACNLAMAPDSTILMISRTEGIEMRNTKTPAFLELAKMAFVLLVAFCCPNPRHAAADEPLSKSLTERLAQVSRVTNQYITNLVNIYKDIHSRPELSLQEERTSTKLAGLMKEFGYEVHTKVGGHGIVCIFRNGTGPTVMVRTDMDALPVVEQTSLLYASKVRARDKAGNDVGVMHACGHDMHMTCWLGTARNLVLLKNMWQGTLVFIGQPAEESGSGARMMLEEGKLFERFPRPDYALALHCDSRTTHGQIAYSDGLAMANVDSVDITVRGQGGHGSAPQTAKDPIVLAARIILDLQTIVSRETNPLDPCVVTVGSIHGGTKHNIIPNDVHLQLTVRSTKDSVRKHTLEAIERIAKAAALGAAAPEPIVTIDPGEFTPALYNDTALTTKTVAVFRQLLGDKNVVARQPIMGGEDFSRYGRAGVPIFLYFLGVFSPERVADSQKPGGRPLPGLHSDLFYPVPEPSIKTGVTTMTMAVLNLLGK